MIVYYLSERNRTKNKRNGVQRSSVAHLPWEQGVAGSNPATPTITNNAGVAQLVERQPSKLNVASSTLVSRSKKTYNGDCSSVGRAPVCGTGCRGFDPRRSPHLRHQLSWQSTRLLIVLSQVQILYDAPFFAGMAELADALDLGSSVPDVRVQVSLSAPYIYQPLGFF